MLPLGLGQEKAGASLEPLCVFLIARLDGRTNHLIHLIGVGKQQRLGLKKEAATFPATNLTQLPISARLRSIQSEVPE
jgi:hypothetical protein